MERLVRSAAYPLSARARHEPGGRAGLLGAPLCPVGPRAVRQHGGISSTEEPPRCGPAVRKSSRGGSTSTRYPQGGLDGDAWAGKAGARKAWPRWAGLIALSEKPVGEASPSHTGFGPAAKTLRPQCMQINSSEGTHNSGESERWLLARFGVAMTLQCALKPLSFL